MAVVRVARRSERARAAATLALLLSLGATACAGARSLVPGLSTPSPREQYAASLNRAGLDAAALTQDWLRAGAHALATAHEVTLPLRETGYYVGNTGNARTTAPHFGLYSPGPIDPAPFLAVDDATPAPVGAPTDVLGAWARTARPSVPLRAGLAAGAPRRAVLEREAAMRIEGASSQSYRVALPDGTAGYVDTRDLLTANRAVRRTRLANTTDVLDAPYGTAPILAAVDSGTSVDEFGRFGTFRMIRLEDGQMGWIADGPTSR